MVYSHNETKFENQRKNFHLSQYFSSLYYTCLISCSCWLPQPLPHHFQGTPWVVKRYLSSETLVTWNFSYHSPIFLQLIPSALLRYASYWHSRKNKTLGFWKPKLWAWLCHKVQVSLNRSWNFPRPLFSMAKSKSYLFSPWLSYLHSNP